MKKNNELQLNARIEQVEVNGKNVPVRFALRDIALYLEGKGKTLSEIGNDLPILELLDIFWLAVDRGMKRTGETPYADPEAFWDDLDDDFAAMERMGSALESSFPRESADEKNELTQVEK